MIRTITKQQQQALIGQKVSVYFNLNNGYWSVKHKGKVIAHVEHVTIKPSKFHVGESGRQRVIAQKCKNVHAWINGELVDFESHDNNRSFALSYNPYFAGYFYRSVDKQAFNDLTAPITFDRTTRKFYQVNTTGGLI